MEQGRIVADRYQVHEAIGRGGMASVWRVSHTSLGGSWALKVLMTTDPLQRDRLLREGRAQSTLRHPNVVAVTDTVEVDGQAGLVLELVDGPSLADAIAGMELSLAQVDDLVQGVLRGVAAAHRQGIVHRDLKPANVLLAFVDDGVVPKVADFGLATGDRERLHTQTGVAMGTLVYMAPEQMRDAARVDARADVYALGVMLYELLSGRRPYEAESLVEAYERASAEDWPALDTLRPDLEERYLAAVAAALVPRPEARPADAGALLALWRGETVHETTSDATFSLDEGLADEPAAAGTLPPTISSLLDTRPWVAALVGGLLGIPAALGTYIAIWGQLGVAQQRLGPWLWLSPPVTAVGMGVLAWMLARLGRGQGRSWSGWFVGPTLVVWVTALAVGLGATLALNALAMAPMDQRVAMGLRGGWIALSAETAGSALLAMMGSVGAASLAFFVLARLPPGRPKALWIGGGGLTVGLGLWGATQALSSGGAGTVGVLLVFVVAVLVAGSLHTSAKVTADLDRLRVLAALLGVLAVASAANGLASEEVVALLGRLGEDRPTDRLAGVVEVRRSLANADLSGITLAWTLAAVGLFTTALATGTRVRLGWRELRGSLLALAVFAVAVLVPWGWMTVRKRELAGAVAPALLDDVAHEQLGARLDPGVPTVVEAGGGLQVGDRVVAVDRRTHATTLELLQDVVTAARPLTLMVERGPRVVDVVVE